MLSNFYILHFFRNFQLLLFERKRVRIFTIYTGSFGSNKFNPVKECQYIVCFLWFRKLVQEFASKYFFLLHHQSADRWFYNRTLFKILITTKCFYDVNFHTWYFADKLPTLSTKICKSFTHRRKPFNKSYKLKLKNSLPLRFSCWYLYLNHFWFGP